MLRRLGFLGLILVSLLAAPPLGAQVVAPLSTQLPRGAPDSVRMSGLFDSLIAVTLTRAGFTVLPTAAADSAWRAAMAAAGGYFDSHTGHIVFERYRAVHAGTLAPFHERVGATLLIAPRVNVVRLRHDGNEVEWDGVREKIGGGGGIQGEVTALSLGVIVTDSAGEAVHCASGGIQLLDKGNFWHQPKRVDDSKVMTDQARDSNAVAIALAGLIAHLPSCGEKP